MSVKAKRHLRSEYSKGKRDLPKPLAFLSDVPFVAVMERNAGGKVERTVEVKPATLKVLRRAQTEASDALERLAAFKEEVSDLAKEVRDLKQQLVEKQNEVERMELNLEIINKNFEQRAEEQPAERSPKSYFNRLQEAGIRPGLPGVSGGIPSLGKRK
ncbi:hypothetical protein K7430_12670 [Stenotrophomonas maltophilia]|nr:hypothetical protein [Stenotrophomonas maltophilia]